MKTSNYYGVIWDVSTRPCVTYHMLKYITVIVDVSNGDIIVLMQEFVMCPFLNSLRASL